MGDYTLYSPGAEAVDSIHQLMIEREKSRREQLMMQHTMLEDQLARQREDRQAKTAAEAQDLDERRFAQTTDEKNRADTEKYMGQHYGPGDYVTDPHDIERANRYMPGAVTVDDPNAQGPVQPGKAQLNTVLRYAGTEIQQTAAVKQKKRDNLIAMSKTAEGHDELLMNPLWAAAQFKDADMPIPAGFFKPPDKPADPYEVDLLARALAKGDKASLTSLGWGSGQVSSQLRHSVIRRSAMFDTETGDFVAPGEINMHPSDMSLAHAQYVANASSLGVATKVYDATQAFARLAEANSQLLLDAMQKVPDTGITWGNYLAREGARVFGSQGMAALEVARRATANEFERLITQPGMNGVFSVEAQRSAKTLLDANATVEQITEAIQTLTTEARNREQAYGYQMKVIGSRLSGASKTPGQPGGPPLSPAGAAGAGAGAPVPQPQPGDVVPPPKVFNTRDILKEEREKAAAAKKKAAGGGD